VQWEFIAALVLAIPFILFPMTFTGMLTQVAFTMSFISKAINVKEKDTNSPSLFNETGREL
jgi:hypothetical protein